MNSLLICDPKSVDIALSPPDSQRKRSPSPLPLSRSSLKKCRRFEDLAHMLSDDLSRSLSCPSFDGILDSTTPRTPIGMALGIESPVEDRYRKKSICYEPSSPVRKVLFKPATSTAINMTSASRDALVGLSKKDSSNLFEKAPSPFTVTNPFHDSNNELVDKIVTENNDEPEVLYLINDPDPSPGTFDTLSPTRLRRHSFPSNHYNVRVLHGDINIPSMLDSFVELGFADVSRLND